MSSLSLIGVSWPSCHPGRAGRAGRGPVAAFLVLLAAAALLLAPQAALASPTFTLAAEQRYVRGVTNVWLGSNMQQQDSSIWAERQLDWTQTRSASSEIGVSRATATAFQRSLIEPTRISGFGSVTTSASASNVDLCVASAFSEHIATFVASEPFTYRFTYRMVTQIGGGGEIQIYNLADPFNNRYTSPFFPGYENTGDFALSLPAGEFLLRISTAVQSSTQTPALRTSTNSYEYTFQIIPAPGAAALLVGASVLGAWRRRRA